MCHPITKPYKRTKMAIVKDNDKMVAARTKFSIATAYAKNAVKDPEIKALYQAAAKGGQRAFNVAIVDALNAPTVESI